MPKLEYGTTVGPDYTTVAPFTVRGSTMRGKIGLVIGVAAGYVLGARAGRGRYEQIKKQADKVWNLDPVQAQVTKVQDFAASTVAALPRAVWSGVKKVSEAVSNGNQTPGDKLDAAVKATKDSADDVQKAAEKSAKAVKAEAEAAANGTRGGA